MSTYHFVFAATFAFLACVSVVHFCGSYRNKLTTPSLIGLFNSLFSIASLAYHVAELIKSIP